MERIDLEKLSKGELVEAYLALQTKFTRPDKTSRTSSKPPSTDKKANREKVKPGGANWDIRAIVAVCMNILMKRLIIALTFVRNAPGRQVLTCRAM